MNKSLEKQIIKRDVANKLLELLLNGYQVTKSDINKMIPIDVALSPEDILKSLRTSNILISMKRNATPYGDSVWFMTYSARKSYLESSTTHKHIKVAIDKKKSTCAAFKKLQTIKKQYGFRFVAAALSEYHI